jgi:hypothetical protein
MSRRLFRGLGLAGLTLLSCAGPASAADEPTTAPPAVAPAPKAPALPSPSLDLSIRARALGLVPEHWSGSAGSLGLETGRPSNGAGTTRMPSATTELARGVYVSVSPSCIPGVDEPMLPAPRRGPPVRR